MIPRPGVLAALILVRVSTLAASDLLEVQAVSDRVLLLHFDDGAVLRHGMNEPRSRDRVVADPLDVVRASASASYTVSSPLDERFQPGVQPVRVGRKTKPTEFAWITEGFDAERQTVVNTSPDRVHEHWIYLELPQPLSDGHTYTVDTGALAKNRREIAFVFDPVRVRSEAIHVNAVGYEPDATEKYGYLFHWAGDFGGLDYAAWEGREFHVREAVSGAVAFTGQVRFRTAADNPELHDVSQTPKGNHLAAAAWDLDFSTFTRPGRYVLSVPGIGASFPFELRRDATRDPFFWVMKGLYQNRSGIELRPPWSTFRRPAPHRPGVTPGFAPRLQYTTTRFYDMPFPEGEAGKPVWEKGLKGPINTWGWYQDAGDWDAYPTHARIPSNLLFLYDLRPDHFTDGELVIPESGNGIPDVLDEAAWLVRFFHRTRHAILDAGYGTGGVGGYRVMGDLWGADTGPGEVDRGSWKDVDRLWIVSGEEPGLTYKYAALAAHLAHLLARGGFADAEGVDWRREAVESWKWAEENTTEADRVPAFFLLRLTRMQAAVALYRLTGDKVFLDAFLADLPDEPVFAEGALLEGYEETFTSVNYVLAARERGGEAAALARIEGLLERTADDVLLTASERRATRWGGRFKQPMIQGQSTTPMIAEGLLAAAALRGRDAAKDRRWLARARTTADTFLGANALNMTWITGLGPRQPRYLFHLDSWILYSRDRDAPGYVPYGPWTLEFLLSKQNGPWSNDWPSHTVYPEINSWPGHERWFEQYSSPLSNEFTVHENSAVAAFVYGYLTAPAPAEVPASPAR